MAAVFGSGLSILRGHFGSNLALSGSGGAVLALRSSTLSIENATFSGNRAFDSARNVGGYGGTVAGIYGNRVSLSVRPLPPPLSSMRQHPLAPRLVSGILPQVDCAPELSVPADRAPQGVRIADSMSGMDGGCVHGFRNDQFSISDATFSRFAYLCHDAPSLLQSRCRNPAFVATCSQQRRLHFHSAAACDALVRATAVLIGVKGESAPFAHPRCHTSYWGSNGGLGGAVSSARPPVAAAPPIAARPLCAQSLQAALFLYSS